MAEQKDAQRIQFLKDVYCHWYGTDCAPILSRAYDEKFVENGKPVDLALHFHTYVSGKDVPVKYVISYYAEAVLDTNGKDTLPVKLDGKTYNLAKIRGGTTFTIQPKGTTTTVNQPKTLTLSKISYKYDGKVKKPSVTVKGTAGKVIPASNYTVTYAKGRKNVAVYAVTVTFKGQYKGTLSGSFKIVPKTTVFRKEEVYKRSKDRYDQKE